MVSSHHSEAGNKFEVKYNPCFLPPIPPSLPKDPPLWQNWKNLQFNQTPDFDPCFCRFQEEEKIYASRQEFEFLDMWTFTIELGSLLSDDSVAGQQVESCQRWGLCRRCACLFWQYSAFIAKLLWHFIYLLGVWGLWLWKVMIIDECDIYRHLLLWWLLGISKY